MTIIEKAADILMVPIMYLVSGTFEKPQQTHFWNNTKLTKDNIKYLKKEQMVFCSAISVGEAWKLGLPLFHIPLFSDWKNYVAIAPVSKIKTEWYAGWITKDLIGVSRIKLNGPVKVLVGSSDAQFFGVTKDGTQIHVNLISRGKIGSGGDYAHVKFL
ncbi:MAG: hypothetical protein NT091_02510 [Candidatus Falkowbacteria bacterium]|nr:hypothetical protein [Candidatus Falkowbacteria bacterium]